MAQPGGPLNTAPPPIPGSFGNPTGANIGLPGVSNVGIPPATGQLPMVPGASNPLPTAFQANGVLPSDSTNMAGLSSGTGLDPNVKRQLDNDYGKGIGDMLYKLLSGGMFNPEVANALINAMQPMRTRGLNDVLSAFGGEGARFSSAAATGTGDFESQFALNEQSTLANLFQSDQAMQLSLLQGILPTVHAEQADSQKGWFQNVMDVLSSFGSLFAPNPNATGNSASGAGQIPGGMGSIPIPGMSGDPAAAPSGSFSLDTFHNILGASGGAALTGGADTSTGGMDMGMLLELLGGG